MVHLCWHGTWEKQAKSILKEGFKPGTYFAAHLEDALAFGGPYIFTVVFSRKAPAWQFQNDKTIPAWRIQSLVQFVSHVEYGENDFRSHRYAEFGRGNGAIHLPQYMRGLNERL